MLSRLTAIRFDGTVPQYDIDGIRDYDDPAFVDLYSQMIDDPEVDFVIVQELDYTGRFRYIEFT
jgi:hypothetical protein